MEERKRPANDQGDTAPPLKRQATATNGANKSHGDNEMPWKDDLERFQKDAIYRQMQEYRREKNSYEAALKDLRKKARDHDDHLRIVDLWWKQLIDEVKAIVQPSTEVDVDMTSSEVPSSLLFSDQEAFEQHLQSRAEDIRDLIKHLYSRLSTDSPEVTSLQVRVTGLLAAEKELRLKLEGSQSEINDLEARLEAAITRYMLAEKKLDRAKSVTAAKFENGLLLGGNAKPSDDSNSAKREDGTANGVADHGEDLVELEQEVKKLQAVVEKQKEHISKLEDEHATLTSERTKQDIRAIPTDDDYAKTELWKQAKIQIDDSIGRVNNLESVNAELREENTKLNSERIAYQAQLEAESRAVLSEKDSMLAKAEADLARIRSNRDDLLADRDIKKASLDQGQEALKAVKDLVSAQEDRIKALESENARLSTTSTNLADPSDLDSLPADDLRSMLRELKGKYEILTGELNSMQTAFQKTSKLAGQRTLDFAAVEEKASRFAAEKSKADQKYFAAMKSKEMQDSRIRTLTLQNSKSSEIVSQLKEADESTRQLLGMLEKQVAELKDAIASKTTECRTASQQSATHASEVSRLNAQLAQLKEQLALKDTKMATTSNACRTAELEVEELRTSLVDTRKNLESWKSKSGQSEQYEMLRMIAYCNICKKRLKDTVMTLCGHTFCHDCVEDRFKNRARKCPNCAKAFGQKDFMKITL